MPNTQIHRSDVEPKEWKVGDKILRLKDNATGKVTAQFVEGYSHPCAFIQWETGEDKGKYSKIWHSSPVGGRYKRVD